MGRMPGTCGIARTFVAMRDDKKRVEVVREASLKTK
jgi:hypothetical protein